MKMPLARRNNRRAGTRCFKFFKSVRIHSTVLLRNFDLEKERRLESDRGRGVVVYFVFEPIHR